jgi:hypothetical protein
MSASGADPQVLIWGWYVGFFLHFGATLAVAIPIAGATILYALLYQRASELKARPLPDSIPQQFLARKRSGFNLLLGMIVTVVAWLLMYFLFTLVWKFAPRMVELSDSVQATSFGSLEEALSRTATIALFSMLIGVGVAVTFFSSMRAGALAFDGSSTQSRSVRRRCFVESPVVGAVLAIVVWWTVFNLSFDIWNLIFALAPASARLIPGLSEPEKVYFAVLSGTWLMLLGAILVPLAWLYLRTMAFDIRYRIHFWRTLAQHPVLYTIIRIEFAVSLALSGVGLSLLIAVEIAERIFGVPISQFRFQI